MKENKIQNYIKKVLENTPTDWLKLTTHRLDIYNENLAKTQFLNQFEDLFKQNTTTTSALEDLPTAYDYIRLGHPLSCVLEWTLAKLNHLPSENIISFSSKTAPILAILRKNLLKNINTNLYYRGNLPEYFDATILKEVYGYNFTLSQISNPEEIPASNDTNAFISHQKELKDLQLSANVDFYINLQGDLGSILFVNGEKNKNYISEIQHVRRRETIAMTPANCLLLLKCITGNTVQNKTINKSEHKSRVLNLIQEITGTSLLPMVASSGLSMQYAIMMGLIHDAHENHKGKNIKFIVPPNCYGGTNDQARRVAACLENVEVVDLLVDREFDMVQSIDHVLTSIAQEDAVPYIIAEIPTNPRVEVPDLQALKAVLQKKRTTSQGETAIPPVFVLDQTFCPNVQFLSDGEVLSEGKAISYASGSKFPSGGKATAGYCVGNRNTQNLMKKITTHLDLCDNEATALQFEILAQQLPSMNQRIHAAYLNTRDFVNFIQEVLPKAKINFVTEELAQQGFTPSVFSLDLPTFGNTKEEREIHKRKLNLKLIDAMITAIPKESKFCVSYGQLKGCYWTVPATSTQGTTKEGDKDYIVRVSVSPELNLDLHKKVFLDFVRNMKKN